nr:hypothetical protein [Tanacetum cinerariifolium]
MVDHAAGTEEEQAKNFQWGIRRSTLNHLMCMSYTDVAQVANTARNYEILHERDDDDAERPDKRRVVTGISRPLNRVVTGTTVIITTVMGQTGEVPSSPGVPLRATPIRFALRVDADTQESVVELLATALVDAENWISHMEKIFDVIDVAQVANAARNYEILHERDDDDT